MRKGTAQGWQIPVNQNQVHGPKLTLTNEAIRLPGSSQLRCQHHTSRVTARGILSLQDWCPASLPFLPMQTTIKIWLSLHPFCLLSSLGTSPMTLFPEPKDLSMQMFFLITVISVAVCLPTLPKKDHMHRTVPSALGVPPAVQGGTGCCWGWRGGKRDRTQVRESI